MYYSDPSFSRCVMGGPNLEVFKFSLYLFVPIAALVHFGDPEWYRKHVVPVCLSMWQ